MTLSALKRQAVKAHLKNWIIPRIKTVEKVNANLATQVQTSMGSITKWKPGTTLGHIYKNDFNGSASKLYDFIVKSFRPLLVEQGILDAKGSKSSGEDPINDNNNPVPDNNNSNGSGPLGGVSKSTGQHGLLVSIAVIAAGYYAFKKL